MTTVTVADAPAGRSTRPPPARILAGTGGSRPGPDLDTHLHAHGVVHLPARRSVSERAALAAALDRSGLTGRGGAGFPLGRKIALVGQQRRRPLVVVNVMEGEPASQKDRVLATRLPHLVLDGAEVLATVVDAAGVVVCVARDRPDSAAALSRALEEREVRGMSATPTEIRLAPSRYVAGEESALARWIAGADARPAFRAARPTVLRVAGRPVLVDNAETLAHAALVARHGPAWFRSLGTAEAPGTTLVTVSGPGADPAVYEVPFGTPLRSLLAAARVGGPLGGVLLGGYGGTWISPDDIGVELAPVPLAAVGASMGAGVVVALPEGACGLAETARIASWMAGESAGQCGPCVFGLPAIAGDLAELAFRGASAPVVERLRGRLAAVQGRGACRHPDGVVRLVRSALTTFGADLRAHVDRGPCPGTGAPSVLPFPRHGAAPWR